MLNGFYGNSQEVLDQPHLFLQERLAVGHAPEHAVKASHGIDASADFVVSREQVFASFLIAKLRFVSEDGGKLSFKLLTDVDDEGGSNVVVERRVNDLERPVRQGSTGILPAVEGAASPRSVQLSQSRQEASLISKNRSRVVIRMSPFPIGQNHNARPSLTNHARDFQSVLPRVLHTPVRNIQRAPPTDA